MWEVFKKLEQAGENSVEVLLNFHWASPGMFMPSWLSQCWVLVLVLCSLPSAWRQIWDWWVTPRGRFPTTFLFWPPGLRMGSYSTGCWEPSDSQYGDRALCSSAAQLFMLWHLFLTERLFEPAVQDSSLLWVPLIKGCQVVGAGESHLVSGAAASSLNSCLNSCRHFLKMIAAGDCWSVLEISVFFQSWHRVVSCSVLAKLSFTKKMNY